MRGKGGNGEWRVVDGKGGKGGRGVAWKGRLGDDSATLRAKLMEMGLATVKINARKAEDLEDGIEAVMGIYGIEEVIIDGDKDAEYRCGEDGKGAGKNVRMSMASAKKLTRADEGRHGHSVADDRWQ